MKKIQHTENDEVELTLIHHVGDYYNLAWRYVGYKKFLWFKIYDKWKSLYLYKQYPQDPATGHDPRDDFNWHNVSFNLGNDAQVQHYEAVKKRVKTKKDLWKEFQVDHNWERFQKDLRTYRAYCDKVNERIDRLAK